MQTEHSVILLVGSDPDILFLRSAAMASAGIWNLRARNADQAIEVLGNVSVAMVVICYLLDQANQQQPLSFLLRAYSGVKVLWMVPGDDCSVTGLLMKVEDTLGEPSTSPSHQRNFQFETSVG